MSFVSSPLKAGIAAILACVILASGHLCKHCDSMDLLRNKIS